MSAGNKELDIWAMVARSLANGRGCIILWVVHHLGSSPGRTGFKMVITEDGDSCGSIGGGVMEYKLSELAKNKLLQHQHVLELKHQVHRAEATSHRSGMICSGEQYVVMMSMSSDELEMVNSIIHQLKANNEVGIRLSTNGLAMEAGVRGKHFVHTNREEWHYTEALAEKFCLHLIGGGHISLALSRLAANLDFIVKVYDHRKQLQTIQQNLYAQEVFTVQYSDLNGMIPYGKTNFVVIMTVGYRTDMEALKTLLDKQYGYLGLLGSKNKVTQMLQELKQMGISKDLLDRIDAPAGIEIKSQTPEEIAVSIASNLILSRRRVEQENR